MDPLIYQYSIGGVIFIVGMLYAFKQGYVGFSGRPLINFFIACFGMMFFAGIQSYLQYADMDSYQRVDNHDDLRKPLCEYPCESRFGQRDDTELKKIEDILLVEQDLKALKAEHESGQLPASQYHDKKETLLERRKLGTPLDYSIMGIYFLLMLVIGTFFGRKNKSTKDFFFGGQRFSWWLISFSLVATTVGSYSFVKYSKIAFGYGIASSQTYMNDWFWMPLLIFGWLPILYFSRVISIPEYFERRFDKRARRIATWLILIYLVGYVGINLFTMGKALNALVGWPIFGAALGVAAISATYVTFGGQTSVIMTDLFQGAMLLLTGLVLLYIGMDYLGGPTDFWDSLPRSHKTAYVGFNEGGAIYGKAGDSSYTSAGIFWQDAMANSAMFYFLNQGMVMRLLAARSMKDSRRSVYSLFFILMPVAAVVVASGGWVGKALVHSGAVPDQMVAHRAFYDAAYILTRPGLFGLIMAALTAALMSTVDTLVTAVSAIVVNDVYKPKFPKAKDVTLLKVARISAFMVMAIGVALVPLFATFDSIYSAHGAFTAAMTPPLVVTLLMGVFCRRFSSRAAFITMIGGSTLILLSILFPEIITPIAQGVHAKEPGSGLLGGMKTYKYMRACFGMLTCFGLSVVGTLLFPYKGPLKKGLVWGTVSDAIRSFKGAPGGENDGPWGKGTLQLDGKLTPENETALPPVVLSQSLATDLGAKLEDLIYITDKRAWLGGLRSGHGMVKAIEAEPQHGKWVKVGEDLYDKVTDGKSKHSSVKLKCMLIP